MKTQKLLPRTVLAVVLTLIGVSTLWIAFHFRQARISAPTWLKPSAQAAPASVRAKADFGQLPLYFVENRGQVDARAAYYVQGSDKAIYFTDRGLTFVLEGLRNANDGLRIADCGLRIDAMMQPASFNPLAAIRNPCNPQSAIHNPQSEGWALKLDFVGARAEARPEGEAQTEAVISYFKGHPSKWKTGLKTFSRIIYRDLWPGIDLVYAGTVNRMKYSFVVRPGADPNQIRLAYRGASEVAVNEAGELEVQTPVGGFSDARPVSFQETDGRQVEITTTYQVQNKSAIRNPQSAIEYGFALGEYDRGQELVIDPVVMVYAGFIGGNGNDFGNGIAVDGSGSVYVTGQTNSTQSTFPDGDGFGGVTGPDTTFNGGTDAFVAKLNAAGTALLYAGYIGGVNDESGIAIAVDSSGSAYITGSTVSSEATFPDGDGFGVVNGPDLTFNGGANDAFVAKINAAGTALLYAGYIGGGGAELGSGIAVDFLGNAYVTGSTMSSEATFPDGDGFGALSGADTTFNGSNDAFVVRINAAGTGFTQASYLGGSGEDQGFDIAVDRLGGIYVAGNTTSTEATFPDGGGFGPLAGPDNTHNGGTDAFIVKLHFGGTAIVYAGYLGGSGTDNGLGLAVDDAGNAYVGGRTDSTEATFPDGDGFGAVTGPDATYNGGLGDAFVAKVNPAGTALVYAGYIGGALLDFSNEVAVDGIGNLYVGGTTASTQTSFPDGDGFGALPSFDNTHNGGGFDAFVAKVTAAGTALVYAGYAGGSGDDQGVGLAADISGNAYLTGQTSSTQSTFPDGDGFGAVPGADTTFNGGGFDAFVVKVSGNIVVNTTADAVAMEGQCSLREAIQAANTNTAVNECPAGLAGLDTIEFNLGAGTPAINVLSALPAASEPVFINGNTGGATRVELNGAGAGVNVSGLQVQGGGSTIRNLVINRFSLAGIVLFSGNGNTVQSCFIGTDATGMVDQGNSQHGIFISCANNLIGGTLAGQGNVISGNNQAGISMSFGAATNNLVQGNRIGLTADASGELGNGTHGVSLDNDANANTVGGTVAGAGNMIGGNSQHGVFISGNISNNNVVQGNRIGTGTEMENFGNGGSGVHLASSAAGNQIGGTATGAGNLIIFNAVGVNLPSAGAGNGIQGNSIAFNAGLGIDLGGGGVTANDAGDGDTGPNNLQNFPVLTSASVAGNNTVVQGTLNSTAATNFRIEFFSNTSCDTSGNGEGRSFLGFTNVTTNGSGNASFTATLSGSVSLGDAVTSTATSATTNTSEFSACVAVNCEYAIAPAAASFSPGSGSGTVAVTATGGCAWTAVSNSPFINVTSGGSGIGNGVVGYSVTANGDVTPRSGTITIAGSTFMVSQAATGLLVFTDFTGGIPPDWTVEDNGFGTYPDGSPATWTAGNPCNRVIPPPFSGTFAIVDASCAGPDAILDERLIPPAFNATGLGTIYVEFFNRYLGAGAPNNIGDLDVSTDGGATWPFNANRFQNVNEGPNARSFNITPFIAGNPANAQVSLHYTGAGARPPSQPVRPARPDAQEISWAIDFAIYHYTLTPGSQTFSSSGGTGNVMVSTSAAVPSPQGEWTATSNAPWITPAANGGTGNGSIGYMVSANTTGTPRTGTVTIAGKTFTVTQDTCALAVSPASVPNGFVGAAYNQTLGASGGTVPYTFMVSAGALPDGLNLTASGTLSGTPTANGTFSFTVKATDAAGCMGTREYTVIISGSGAGSLVFYPLPAPVRLLETRQGFSGCIKPGMPINANSTFTLPARGACTGIPSNATAVTGNITVVPENTGGYLTLFPSNATQPIVANSNFKEFEITNNVFTVGLGSADGAFKIFASATTEVIVDVTGYYAPPAAGGLYFHPLPEPVRLVETRTIPGLPGCIKPGVPLPGNADFDVQGRSPLNAPCSVIPASAQVLVGNATTVFPSGSGFLTIYPSDADRPVIASSNYAGGDVINGPFAVKLGADGKFKVYTFHNTDLVIDILGYYSADAVDANGAGLLFNPLPKPVRLLETRPDFPGFPLTGCFRTDTPIPGGMAGIRTQPAWGVCDGVMIPNSARAVVGNVTVVNPAAEGFLTFYPGNVATAPTVATSNYPFPVVFGYNRHYFVGLSPAEGTFKILTQVTTDVIVDVSGYFAP